MNIRGKLRQLLLAATLLPLLLSSGIFLVMLSGLGAHFASDTKDALTEQAYGHLNSLIRDSELLVQQKFQLIDWVTAGQIQEIQRSFPGEQNRNSAQAAQQDNLIIAKNSAGALTAEKLKSLGDVFYQLSRKSPGLILRQYVAFTPDQGYFLPSTETEMVPVDLSDREWLQKTFQNRTRIRVLVKDANSRSLNLVIGVPLPGRDGTICGVTAVELSLDDLFSPLRLPESWQSSTRVMLVARGSKAEKLAIVAEVKSGGNWQFPLQANVFDSALLEASAAIENGLSKNRSGVLMVKHQDKIRHWAYGTMLWDSFFPLVMLEHEQIVALALESEQHVLGKTRLGLALVGFGLLVFIGLSIIAAGRFSQAVTDPVRTLSAAFNRLAKGDFTTRVSIETGDELEELGHNFNDLGGKLADRNRMASSLALAREVQQHLLPSRPPVVAGVELFSRGIPCDEVGGDYFDFIFHDDNKAQLGIAVGDVSGHGVPAALLMASVRGILRSHAWCHGGDLAFLFRLLNQQLTKDSTNDRFMTLFYGVLDREMGTLCWNSAGHGPVLLYQALSQRLVELEPTGPPLGIDESLSHEPVLVGNLGPGDILLAGTDGIWEGRNQSGEIWGIEEFKSKLQQVTTRSALEIGQFLFTELAEFRDGQKQEDDITLVIAKLT